MESILIVSSSEKGKEMLRELLRGQNISRITTAQSGAETRRVIVEQHFDLIFVNMPLPDEYGDDLAMRVAEVTDAGIVLLAAASLLEELADKVEDYGVYVLEKPISRQLFYHSLRLLKVAGKRQRYLKEENSKLRSKIQEMSLVNKAKCLLVQYRGFSEEQAHKYVERQAMDRRCSRLDIAQRILTEYQN